MQEMWKKLNTFGGEFASRHCNTYKNNLFFIGSVKSLDKCAPSSIQKIGNTISRKPFIISTSGMGTTSKLNCKRLAADSGVPVICFDGVEWSNYKQWIVISEACSRRKSLYSQFQTSRQHHGRPYLDSCRKQCSITTLDHPNRNGDAMQSLAIQSIDTNPTCLSMGICRACGSSTLSNEQDRYRMNNLEQFVEAIKT